MTRPRTVQLDVPTGWSAEQARAVLDFLEEVHAALWAVYQGPVLDLVEKEIALERALDVAGGRPAEPPDEPAT